VEDKAVEEAMVNFGNGLKAFEKELGSEARRGQLENMNYALAHAMRDSVQAGWGASLKMPSLKMPQPLTAEATTSPLPPDNPKIG
jgi:hypothetical protein